MKKNILLIIILLLTNVFLYSQDKSAYVSSDFKKYNLKPGNIPELWEDGIRTGGKKNSFEWWYYDAHLDDGTVIVVSFHTKSFIGFKGGISPFISVTIDLPDGTSIKKGFHDKAENFYASDSTCNVVIGKNYFRGNLENYEIHFEDEDLTFDATLQRTTQSWRPKTGIFHYGTKDKYFAWLVPIPKGTTQVNFTYKNKSYNSKGSCYHDHNFGNENMTKMINHWYWSRAEIGPYTVIASELIAIKKYNSESIVVFNLSKDGETVVDKGANVSLYRTYDKINSITEKPESDKILFIYESEDKKTRYELTLKRENNIIEIKILDGLFKNKIKRGLAKLLSGFTGSYVRMLGTAELKVFKNDIQIDKFESNKAVWELMYFGKPYE